MCLLDARALQHVCSSTVPDKQMPVTTTSFACELEIPAWPKQDRLLIFHLALFHGNRLALICLFLFVVLHCLSLFFTTPEIFH